MKCPHQKEIVNNNILGLIIYNHKDDNKPCDHLNRLDIKTDTIATMLFKNIYAGKLEPTKEMVSLYVTSRDVRMLIYHVISQQEPDQLIETLLALEELLANCAFESDTYYHEMFEVFGEDMLSNVKIVNGIDYKDKYTQQKKPVLSVYKLGIKDMKGRLYESSGDLKNLEDIVDSMEQPVKEGMQIKFIHQFPASRDIRLRQYISTAESLYQRRYVPPDMNIDMIDVLEHLEKYKEAYPKGRNRS